MALASGAPEQAARKGPTLPTWLGLAHSRWHRACQHTARPRVIARYRDCKLGKKKKGAGLLPLRHIHINIYIHIHIYIYVCHSAASFYREARSQHCLKTEAHKAPLFPQNLLTSHARRGQFSLYISSDFLAYPHGNFVEQKIYCQWNIYMKYVKKFRYCLHTLNPFRSGRASAMHFYDINILYIYIFFIIQNYFDQLFEYISLLFWLL